MRRQLQNYWFVGLVIGLSVLLGYNILSSQARYVLFFQGFFYRGPLVDEARWQVWADHNKDFFGPLANGAKVSLALDPRDSTGLLFEKSMNRIHVSKTHVLFRQRYGVLFAMDAEEAENWLALSLPHDGNRFWDAIKRSTAQGKSKVYTTGTYEELQQYGYMAFLRSFDARPALPSNPKPSEKTR